MSWFGQLWPLYRGRSDNFAVWSGSGQTFSEGVHVRALNFGSTYVFLHIYFVPVHYHWQKAGSIDLAKGTGFTFGPWPSNVRRWALAFVALDARFDVERQCTLYICISIEALDVSFLILWNCLIWTSVARVIINLPLEIENGKGNAKESIGSKGFMKRSQEQENRASCDRTHTPCVRTSPWEHQRFASASLVRLHVLVENDERNIDFVERAAARPLCASAQVHIAEIKLKAKIGISSFRAKPLGKPILDYMKGEQLKHKGHTHH
ncbi:hypothetical protein PIB30_081252 [Stylosanthes scabra]|uniref:Uncharacterized protein n=1 Tax=Stylosanthes scabra TaxID=79078 RepID=A0ABU6RS43_9FABA|nr:hypothetical protein [Stylosanthes scabra]